MKWVNLYRDKSISINYKAAAVTIYVYIMHNCDV